jgi:uridylate kinase
MTENKYKRVLLKLSGELFGEKSLDNSLIITLAQSIAGILQDTNVQLAIMNGGGNLFRGRDFTNRSHNVGMMHNVGMLGTVMNALVLQDKLLALDIDARVMSALPINDLCEPYIMMKALSHLNKGRTVLLAAGMGRTFFSTDTAAAHRAVETQADVLIKATKVDGVYDSDPKQNIAAIKYDRLTFREAIDSRLMIMDATAFTFCQDNGIPVIVCDGNNLRENVVRTIRGERVGTLMTNTR